MSNEWKKTRSIVEWMNRQSFYYYFFFSLNSCDVRLIHLCHFGFFICVDIEKVNAPYNWKKYWAYYAWFHFLKIVISRCLWCASDSTRKWVKKKEQRKNRKCLQMAAMVTTPFTATYQVQLNHMWVLVMCTQHQFTGEKKIRAAVSGCQRVISIIIIECS